METDDEIRAKVEREFDLEIAAVRALDETSNRLIDHWSQRRGMRGEGDRILAMAIARGVTTFKATIRLIEGGFGREALMLNRSLFEGMAVAHWVAANPEEAAKRFALANEYEIHLMREKVGEMHPEYEAPPGAGQLREEDLAEARKLFGHTTSGSGPATARSEISFVRLRNNGRSLGERPYISMRGMNTVAIRRRCTQRPALSSASLSTRWQLGRMGDRGSRSGLGQVRTRLTGRCSTPSSTTASF